MSVHLKMVSAFTFVLMIQVFSLAACTTTAPVHSSDILNGPDGSIVKNWDEEGFVEVYSSESVPENLEAAVEEAVAIWEQAAGRQLFEFKGKSDSKVQEYDGLNVLYIVGEKNPSGNLGETYVMARGDTLLEADIVFHEGVDRYALLNCYDASDVCRINSKKVDFLTLALHEIGHVLGFAHSAKEDSIMSPDIKNGDVIHRIDDELREELVKKYNSGFLVTPPPTESPSE